MMSEFKIGEQAWFVFVDAVSGTPTMHNINIISAEIFNISPFYVEAGIVQDCVTIAEYKQPKDCIFKSREECLQGMMKHLKEMNYYEE